MTAPLAHRLPIELHADPARVVAVAPASAACTVTANEPATVGVPPSSPVCDNVMSAGNAPVRIDQEYAPAGEACSCTPAYGTFRTPAGSVAVTIVNTTAGGATVSVKALATDWLPLDTRALNWNVPALEGMPARSPAADRLTPAGRLPPATASQTYVPEPPVAPSWAL